MGRVQKKWQRRSEIKRPNKEQAYPEAIRENADFEAYYKKQGIVPDDEWEAFMSTLREPLPAAFRITGSKGQSLQLRNMVRDEIFSQITSPVTDETESTKLSQEMESTEILSSEVTPQETSDVSSSYEARKANTIDDNERGVATEPNSAAPREPLKPPRCLRWYPDSRAWQLEYSRVSLRNNKGLKKLHNFLVSESESGNISRQEAVSMIPPLLLDVKQHHRVLDLCAAPGSKTSQIIEYLHADSSEPIPTGMVIANDADSKRCNLMSHQLSRLKSPSVIVINHDASRLPNMFSTNNSTGNREPLLFDRVLCDVPCSGDGTIRKNPDIWRTWGPGQAVNLHSTQKGILKRGLEMLKVGGRLVYSTCSLNPLENEAIIAYTLNECGGSVNLVDCSENLPGLLRIGGLPTWQVKVVKSGEWCSSYEAVPVSKRTQVRSSMFPPANIDSIKLEYCLRILPHHQNTGGFFVAVLEKVRDLPWMTKQESPDEVNDANLDKVNEANLGETIAESAIDAGTAQEKPDKEFVQSDEPPQKKPRYQGSREDPFNYMNAEDETWQSIRDFYGVMAEFDPTWLMVRTQLSARKRQIYVSSPAIRDLVQNNSVKVRLINTGVKLMSRSEHKMANCSYSVSQEGIANFIPYLTKRRLITLNHSDCIQMLSSENPKFSRLGHEAQEQFKELGIGGCVCVYQHTDSSGDVSEIALAGWRGVTSCRVYVHRYDRHHYLRLCGVDPDKALNGGRKTEEPNTVDDSTTDKQTNIEPEPSLDQKQPSEPTGQTNSPNDKLIDSI